MVNLADTRGAIFRRYFASLAFRDFRNMWLANVSAQSAAWGLIVARGWLVFDMTHSSASVGIVTFAAMAPLFFVPPLAGVLADRMDRRKILAGTYAVNLFTNLGLGLLALAGDIAMWQIVLLTLVNGMARAVQLPTSQALAANLVPKDKLLNALSLTAAVTHGARLVGPGLAVPLLGFLGAPAAFFLCSLLYAVGWAQVLRVRTPQVAQAKKRESIAANFTAGLRYAWRRPMIRMVIAMVMFHCALTMAFESLLPSFSSQRLDAGEGGFGMLMMGVGAGSLVGSTLVGGIDGSLVRGRVYLVVGVLSGFGQALMALTSNVGLAVASAVVMGAGTAAFMTMAAAITQSLAGDEYRGRLASINTFSLGGVMSAMNLLNGVLGTRFSAASLLLAMGLLFVGIMGMAAVFSLPRQVYLRGIPAEEGVAPVPSR